ncbi:family 2A encapsulin nanocompartment cargo protein cysteine desulfurase [Microlunatus panaciterrae]|uniref:cysteine desulfurase n=1 Tax=Microlunatus panaciterrae TaxID=400768 RepID=A0ABS2RP46_9ACTN|nr:family 2A encapsulin nanocompartment cargo protein cysteine desulfurase [Microlunatus panaciterrae]MBM7799714.1 cysteine desulfurase/selenocysteine lyase [Microlunatus panaciterrae]
MITHPTTSEPSGSDLPGWLPDEATLSRLANALFAALPGTTVEDNPAGSAGHQTPGGTLDSVTVPQFLDPLPPLIGPPPTGSRSAGPVPITEPARRPGIGSITPHYYFLDQPSPGHGPRGLEIIERNPVPGWAGEGRVPQLPGDPHPPFDVQTLRRDFPILAERVNGRPLIWFDNAATTQKPLAVIERLVHFYAHENSNIHRGAHTLAARATDAYEGARAGVARFLNAGSAEEIIFVRGATEAINLVAQTWGRKHIKSGDEIIISHLEHHANIVPWQMLALETGAVIKVIAVNDAGELLMNDYARLLSDRTRLVAVTHVSNALGTITPAADIVDLAHRAGARVLIDGAQSVPHLRVDVQQLGADFYVFSGHKIFGPTGIGVVHGRPEVLEDLPPWQGGGNMIIDVTLERSTYQRPPHRFEAGTGNIADAAGLATALEYVERIGIEAIAEYEHFLVRYATAQMREVPGLRLVGTAAEKASVLSFVLDGYTAEQVGSALNQEGIAVRAGHHCAQPILRRLGLEATVRPSLAFYNTCAEVDTMVAALHRLATDAGGYLRGVR